MNETAYRPVAEADVAVIGGGLAGLAAARTAERLGATAIVLEGEREVGGLARSVRIDGYTFDCSGHLLHLARPETRALVNAVSKPSDWLELERRSSIFIEGHFVPYPFQLHLAFAPEGIRSDCLRLLPAADWADERPAREVGFLEWVLGSLGEGIGNHFMFPYNEKLSTVAAEELTCEWLGRFVPRPSIAEIRAGALERQARQTGYNASFLYPRAGGIDLLPKALARELGDVRTSARVVAIEPRRRLVQLASGERIRYREGVISSAPLNQAARFLQPRRPELDLSSALRANRVTCVNLGLKRLKPPFDELHWVYLPESRFRAYRVGVYNRFSETMAPRGRFGVYVEIAHQSPEDRDRLVREAIDDLLALGAIDDVSDVETAAPVQIPIAYVIHDRRCAWAREKLERELARAGVHTVGRYGRWEYAAMEDALRQGIAASEAVLVGAAGRTEEGTA